MISVFFNCSSPFVGYRIYEADYVNRKMEQCNASSMTEEAFHLFNISGSYTLLMDINGRRYFHGRQFDSEVFDEQGRRIYANVAFIGEHDDKKVIDRIAAYALFSGDEFYKCITDMITLTKEGYEVDYGMLEEFINRFKTPPQFEASDTGAGEIYHDLVSGAIQEQIKYIVLESDWAYFAKQAGMSIGENSAKYRFTQGDVGRMSALTTIMPALPEEKLSVKNTGNKTERKTEKETEDRIQPSNDTDNLEKIIRGKDREIAELSTKLLETSDELRRFKTEIKALSNDKAKLISQVKKLKIAALLFGLGGIVITAIIAAIIYNVGR